MFYHYVGWVSSILTVLENSFPCRYRSVYEYLKFECIFQLALIVLIGLPVSLLYILVIALPIPDALKIFGLTGICATFIATLAIALLKKVIQGKDYRY
ncbi:MAG: hypothetical protein JWL85_505 [Candidatus Saccharibacteria bacterium]|nr:hypothetical protein [Candidatus Saccharibacteria bacterium]